MNEQWEQRLAAAARKLRNLLHDVDSASEPLWRGPALDAAIHRYVKIFLPMLAAHAGLPSMKQMTNEANRKLYTLHKRVLEGDMNRYELSEVKRNTYGRPFRILGLGRRLPDTKPFSRLGSRTGVVAVPPVPPLDVAFCWLLHRLSPLDYAEDCRKLFGAPLPTKNGLDYFRAQNAGEEREVIARLQWCCFAHAARKSESFELFKFKTCRRERKTFLPNYLWPPYEENQELKQFPFDEPIRVLEKPWVSPLRSDLKAAAARQEQFLYTVSHEYFDGDESLKRGAKRYLQFLALMKDNPGVFLVPMYDIDLVWHAHILRDTNRYAEDTRRFVGRFVNHKEDDDRTEGGKLDRGFKRTIDLWREKYGEEYVDVYTSYKGRIGDNVERVFGRGGTKTMKHAYSWRKSFVHLATGCASCSGETYDNMHRGCRKKFAKAARVARGGQVRGGVCAAMYSLGDTGCSTMYSQPSGTCGTFKGSARGVSGCGNEVSLAGACGESGCEASAGDCDGDGSGGGGSGCGD